MRKPSLGRHVIYSLNPGEPPLEGIVCRKSRIMIKIRVSTGKKRRVMEIENTSYLVSDEKLLSSLVKEFTSVAVMLSEVLARNGVQVEPFKDGLPYFRSLPVSKQQEILHQLKFYYQLCLEQILEGHSLKDSHTFTWRAFRKLGLKPTSDLFSFIEDGDLIELYDRDNRQLYRNFAYYDYCSYSLEELYSLEWWKLFERDPLISEQIMNEGIQVLASTEHKSIISKTPKHIVREIQSMGRLTNTYQLKVLSPVFSDGFVEGAVIVLRARSGIS